MTTIVAVRKGTRACIDRDTLKSYGARKLDGAEFYDTSDPSVIAQALELIA